MTQQKSKKAPKLSTGEILKSNWNKLSHDEQSYVTNFFNLHNAAQAFYQLLSDAGKDYVNYCINLSVDISKTEKKNSAQG